MLDPVIKWWWLSTLRLFFEKKFVNLRLAHNGVKITRLCLLQIIFVEFLRDALIRLQDTSTYATITNDKAAKVCDDLYKQYILAWAVKGQKKKTISDDEIKYIRKHCEGNCKGPYGYFYLHTLQSSQNQKTWSTSAYQTCMFWLWRHH